MYRQRAEQSPIPYEEAGDGFPVFMVHGRLNDSRLWAGVSALLAGRYRSIRPDLRTDGQSYTASAGGHADRLLRLLDWLGLRRVHLVSYGAGWSWTAELAVQAPHRVASLTVIDPIVPRAEQTNAIQESWHLEMLLQWLSVSHGNTVRRPEHAAALAAVVAQQTHARLPGAESSRMAPATGLDMPPMEGIRCPVLAMVGQNAPAESKALVASVFGQVRLVQLCLVPGAVRHSPLEAPAIVAERLERFLSTIA
ncbi:MAG TPA: alpha/beta hydrolase [Symbiobacteriaceae bacterium]|nr:alpha/beta hydrolase [Symbiobacteriaceae bacterium]